LESDGYDKDHNRKAISFGIGGFMVKTLRHTVAIMICIFFVIARADGQDLSSYLILQDINGYKASKNPSSGQGPGILVAAGHFYHDHKDMTFRISYFNLQTKVGPDVQVTQHAGGDSDRWLLHEVEDGYRTNDTERLGLLTKGVRLREINGNKFISLRGSSYSWVSDRIVVEISYTDLYGNKPEPLEIVQAYLQKFPSTIPAEFVLDRAHDERWIKNEMERRLWLCEKWFLQLQMGKVPLDETLDSVVKSMGIFLDYRERYYGIKSKDEKIALLTSLNQRDGTSIKNRLSTYKTWWAVNKGRSISLL
jgi:hypothetical protein